MNRQQLIEQIKRKQSFLCVGLDTDIEKIPKHLLLEEDPVFAFNKAIIDATKDYTVAYKINTAFYEAQGIKGWVSLAKTLAYIPDDILTIADAKRGDIGNTSDQYAKTFFQTYTFDGVTVAPYMGKDSVEPFLKFTDHWTILLALTSNAGSTDFQHIKDEADITLHENVLMTAINWENSSPDNLMFVVGATQAQYLTTIRTYVPDHFLLIPGVGAQGGSLEEVSRYGMTKYCGLLVNNSRAIIFASDGEDFAEAAGNAAQAMQKDMAMHLRVYSQLLS